MKNNYLTKIVVVVLMIVLCSIMTLAISTPRNTQDFLKQMSNPKNVQEYKDTISGSDSMFATGNNLYIKSGQGNVNSYTFVSTSKGEYLARGRTINPKAEFYVEESALDAIVSAGGMQACIAKNYLNKGKLVVKGRGARIIVGTIRVLCAFQSRSAGPSSVDYNGKTYYKVIPGQTGNEVCQDAGLTCVGMSPSKDAGVCKAFHSSASTQNIIHGSQYYWYCNGQNSLVCDKRKDSCTVCEACNPNLNCYDDPHSAWGDEIYVECAKTGTTPPKPITPVLAPIDCIGMKPGAPCGKDACGPNSMGTCGGGMPCVANRCIAPIPPLNLLKADGASCSNNAQCQSGKCVWTTGKGYVCTTKSTFGQPCSGSGDCDGGWCIYVSPVVSPTYHVCSCNPSFYTTTQCSSIPGSNKELGEACSSNSQCQSGHCVQNTRLTKLCSCRPDRVDVYSCKPPTQKGGPGAICQHGGECRDGLQCVYSGGGGPDRTYKCSCEMFSLNTAC